MLIMTSMETMIRYFIAELKKLANIQSEETISHSKKK